MSFNKIEYKNGIDMGKATIVVPTADGAVKVLADVSSIVEKLYFLALGKDGKFAGTRSLPAMTAAGMVATPKAFLAFAYKSETHTARFCEALDVCFDIATCSDELENDTEIVKYRKLIQEREAAIKAKHTLADTATPSTVHGKGTKTQAPVATGIMAMLAELEKASEAPSNDADKPADPEPQPVDPAK